MQLGVGKEESWYQTQDGWDWEKESRGKPIDWSDCWAEVEIVVVTDSGFWEHIETEIVSVKDAGVAIAQKDRAVVVEIKVAEAEIVVDKEDKGPAEVERGGDDICSWGAENNKHVE